MKFRVEGIYDARKLGIPQMLILGLQHMFAMFGATILVPILVNNYFHGEGLTVQVTLFCAGFGTLLFHVLTKMKIPIPSATTTNAIKEITKIFFTPLPAERTVAVPPADTMGLNCGSLFMLE